MPKQFDFRFTALKVKFRENFILEEFRGFMFSVALELCLLNSNKRTGKFLKKVEGNFLRS